MSELHEHRIKRLKMRSMRRGIKEMDVILKRFSDALLDTLSYADIRIYDALLSENDHDLYQWVTGQVATPEPYADLIGRIVADLPRAEG